jgi:hypothetical protein
MATRKSLALIERALLQLPVQCRYHGDRIDRGTESWVGRSCCDTGFPSLLRREALVQLAELNEQPSAIQLQTELDRIRVWAAETSHGAAAAEINALLHA